MHGAQLHGITSPLLTKADGTKMGKTESGAVWLSPDRTSPYQFYQYWRNVADEDAGKCLRFLTELPQEEILELDRAREADPGRNESQVRLAEELTRLCHGDSGLATAERATQIFFGGAIEGLDDRTLLEIFADVPGCELARTAMEGEGYPVIDAFVDAGLCKSKGEARRAVREGGANVNNQRVTDESARLTMADLASESVIVLRRGKKKFGLLRLV